MRGNTRKEIEDTTGKPVITSQNAKDFRQLITDIVEDAPALVKKIGKTTYKVRVHFSQTSTETMSDKIKRMLKNEIQQM